jgi:hypothetical protein
MIYVKLHQITINNRDQIVVIAANGYHSRYLQNSNGILVAAEGATMVVVTTLSANSLALVTIAADVSASRKTKMSKVQSTPLPGSATLLGFH